MPRLIGVFAGSTVTLLVLSCRGSIITSYFPPIWKNVDRVDCVFMLYQGRMCVCVCVCVWECEPACVCVFYTKETWYTFFEWEGNKTSLVTSEIKQTIITKTNHTSTGPMIMLGFTVFHTYEPRHKKTCLSGLRPGITQTGLLSYRLATGLKFWL